MSMHTARASLPPVATPEEWAAARAALLIKEKAATRARDALAAERRALPMVRMERAYTFEGPDGRATLADMFDGCPQLIVYHFMYAPGQAEGCRGCSMCVDNFCDLSHVRARGVSLALVSLAPRPELVAFQKRMGWTMPWYSSHGTTFNADLGVTVDGREHPGLSVFVRDGESVYRTYFTTARGLEEIGTVWSLLDATPFGRQETWQSTPAGRPQSPPYEWWRHHDRYGEPA